MNNNTQILAEALFTLSLLSSFGISFLMFLEIIKHVGVFRGANAVILSVLIAILMEVIPIIIFMTGYTPTDVDPTRSFIINYDLWPAIIVTEVTYVLILGIMIIRISLNEDEFFEADKAELQTKSNKIKQ
jgi:hypothetical protein